MSRVVCIGHLILFVFRVDCLVSYEDDDAAVWSRAHLKHNSQRQSCSGVSTSRIVRADRATRSTPRSQRC